MPSMRPCAVSPAALTHPFFDLLVVGAGPAGLTAALTATQQGLRVAMVDEQHDVGGQIFRQPPPTFAHTADHIVHTAGPVASAVANTPDRANDFTSYPWNVYRFGPALLQQARAAHNLVWLPGTTAWGVFQADHDTYPVQLAVSRVETDTDPAVPATRLLHGKKLLIATGAYDMPVAFPGWTLPGVMTAGGVQTLIKSQFVLPGQRFVLAGSHPLLLLVADLLVQVGAQVVEVAVARPKPAWTEIWPTFLRNHRALLAHVPLLRHTVQAWRRLQRHQVPVRFGSLIQQAEGNPAGDVAQVSLCDIDANWQPLAGSERVHQVDTLVIGYGLLASSELARQAGCAVRWQPAQGGWVVQHDAHMRSSVPHIYVAGEPAGVAGAGVAHHQGRLAALDVVQTVTGAPGRGTTLPQARQTRHALRRAQRFAAVVQRFFEPRWDALAQLACRSSPPHQSGTLICRCEEVSIDTVLDFLRDHPHVGDINSVKLACRTGMGMCQGRYCQHTVAHLLARARGCAVAQAGMFTAQAPVKPVPLAALAQLAQERESIETTHTTTHATAHATAGPRPVQSR